MFQGACREKVRILSGAKETVDAAWDLTTCEASEISLRLYRVKKIIRNRYLLIRIRPCRAVPEARFFRD